MPSLWIDGAKAVRSDRQNYVGSFPHLPHRFVGKFFDNQLLPTSKLLSPKTLRAKYTQLSTAKIAKTTDEISQFYPLSTPPTITTTIYINRRGAVQ